MGSYGQVMHTSVNNITFRVYTEEEIKEISVVKITNDQSFNELGHQLRDGIYDLRMGPLIKHVQDVCETCGQDGFRCLGHCGHIELPLPVYNPIFYEDLKKLLSVMCISCYKLQSDEYQVMQLSYQIRLLNEGYGQQALEVQDMVAQIMSDERESDEVLTGVGDRIIQGSEKNFNKSNKMQAIGATLKTYYEKVIEEGTCHREVSTSIIKAIQQQIIKKFVEDCKTRKLCKYCKRSKVKLTFQYSRFMVKSQRFKNHKKNDALVTVDVDNQSYITTEQIRTILRKCWEKDKELLVCLYPILASSKLEHPTDLFFMTCLLVMPPKFRPCNLQGGIMVEHESSVLLKGVVRMAKVLTFLISVVKGTITELPEELKYLLSEVSGETPVEKTQSIWYQMQSYVDNLFDSEINSSSKLTTRGIRQVIEKKCGLFRRNLMGKRVNYSARSVAAPDPLLAVDEVGVPMDFALKLTYPVPVTQWNVQELRQLVKNGPAVYPGAVMIEDEEGKKKRLRDDDAIQRIAIANKLLTPPESHVRRVNATKIVYRHLQNGDFVLMNRQPTLHRPSIQAHRARVLPKDRVLRMPYANCKAYNADFDGDELNLHFPQNELARSEAHHIVTTHNQYLTPKDGSPLAGLIQDCVVASVMLTMRQTFFSREDYQQLVYTGLSDKCDRIKMLPPAILKPKQLWSGKQVISTLLHNIIPKNVARPSFTFKTSVKVDMWQTNKPREWKAGGFPEKKRGAMTDSDFIMVDGELLCGVIDKNAIGSTSYGLIHTCYDLYGGSVASKLLSSINRLCVYYLKWAGHTISVKEFITPSHVSAKRRAVLADLIKRTPAEVSAKFGIAEEHFQDYYEKAHMKGSEKDMAAIDAAYTSVLGSTTSEVTGENERGLIRRSLDNHMRMMVDTGAKGSKVNMNQIASLFGSVAIDGKRMPLSITGRSLPSFKPYDPNPVAGGYISNRFMTGINPQSYFFLCIVGRDSLQHTAVKTADSGYLQRCLIKHLEGIHVKYDMTVRNSDGLVLQFDYGEDGLDVTKVPFLKNPETLDVVVKNHSLLLNSQALSLARSVGEKDLVDAYTRKMKKWHKKNSNTENVRRSAFLKFSKKMKDTVESAGYSERTGRANSSKELQDMWHNMTLEEKKKFMKDSSKRPDPVNSVFSGASNLGVVSEAVDDLIERYYEEMYSRQPTQQQKLTWEEVATTVHMKALNSKVDPGEAVGALCAQAIGEPLTQMTLNTFHFAGKDELNVTLGVPRMVEILKTANKKISTPIMEVAFHPHITRSQAESLRIRLSEVSLSAVMLRLDVRSEPEKNRRGHNHRRINIKFTFLPHREYKHIYAVNPSQVLNYVEHYFIPKVLLKEIQKSCSMGRKMCSSADTTERKSKEKGNTEDNDDDDGLNTAEDTERYREKIDGTFGKVNAEDDDDNDVEEVGEEDADATAASRKRKSEEQDYSEDENEAESSDKDESEKETVSEDEGLGEETKSDEEDLKAKPNVEESRKRKECVTVDKFVIRKEALKACDSWIVDYDFDRNKEEWCEVTIALPISGLNYDIPSIVRQKSEKALIHFVPNIRRVFIVEKDGKLLLRTEGVNILKMCEWEHMLDVNRLYTNNIHQVAERYGIEAAQRSVIRELRAVQSAYDIKVDFRHLSLLADYFTCEGVYKACSRSGLNSCVSPLQKMSFETCLNVLKNAILRDEKDHMSSPSANIALGQPVKMGTNSMHILPILT
ncbi:DNA-directed RNA polymerase I subunit RPA1 [Cherax quadricarinatus]